MSYTDLVEQEEESSQEYCWVTDPCALLRSSRIQETSCCNDNGMESCRDSQSGMTSEPSTENRGRGGSMSYAVGSRVPTSVPLVRERGSPESKVDSGEKCRESFTKWDRDTSSWRTHQCSLLGGWEPYSEIWPKWGMMRDGACWEQMTLALPIAVSESGYSLPTPTASSYGSNRTPSAGGTVRPSLQTMATKNTWPTPTLGDAKSSGSRNTKGSKAHAGVSLTDAVRKDGGRDRLDYAMERGETRRNIYAKPNTGKLNPMWVEWLMGWPIGWTDLKPQEMDKLAQWQQQHSNY